VYLNDKFSLIIRICVSDSSGILFWNEMEKKI